MRRPIYLFFLGIFSIITIVGCTTNEVEISQIIKEEIEKQPLSELDTNISRWKANKLSNYQFDFQWFCFCEPDYISPVTITVEDDVISHVMYSATKIQVQEDKRSRYKTIDDLFSFKNEEESLVHVRNLVFLFKVRELIEDIKSREGVSNAQKKHFLEAFAEWIKTIGEHEKSFKKISDAKKDYLADMVLYEANKLAPEEEE